ncbi:THO complex subunit 2 [Podila clonocystis]|nr:THO complex subunit 2 [Podila clonocystis]
MPNARDAMDDAPVGTDLPATSNSPIAAPTIMPPTSAPPTLFVSFIGCLGLDPLQALDGLLACFAMNTLLYCGFFIKLLHDWTTAAGVVDKIRVGGARLLASKFKELTAQENAHKDATALYLTTAVLVKEKAIHIEEIYSKLSPSYLETQWTSDMKPNCQSNVSEALVDTTTLTENETLVAVSKVVAKADITVEVDQDLVPLMRSPDQKVALLSACLFVGDTGIANFIQKRVPRIATIYPEIGDLISRIIRFKIQGIYDSLPLDTRCPELLQDCVMQIDVQPIQRGLTPTSMDIGRFESLYPEWYTQQVPCSTLDDIAQIKPLLDIVGIRIHRDPAVILMLCRLGAVSLGHLSCSSSTNTVSAKAEPTNVKDMWMDLTGSLFLPAISLANANSGISTEILQILNTMSFETRVDIYRQWESMIKLDPELQVSFEKTEEAAKDTLHNITMQDVEERRPVFAVLAGSNPLAAYTAVMKQIENPDCVVEPLVSACKHASGLSLDMLSYTIVEHLSKIHPVNKVQRNGAPAEWMQKLGKFCGAMYRQQPKADLDALMAYLVDNICKCNGRDLVVLKELLIRMGSAGDTSHLSATQALMMAGGEALREEAFYDSTSIKTDIESSRRLQEALIRDSNAT